MPALTQEQFAEVSEKLVIAKLDRLSRNLAFIARLCHPARWTRSARAIFLGTAPHAGGPNAGINAQSLRLGCAEPGDQLPSSARRCAS